jgi:hypothetical protein
LLSEFLLPKRMSRVKNRRRRRKRRRKRKNSQL